jgi:hypothetical protein
VPFLTLATTDIQVDIEKSTQYQYDLVNQQRRAFNGRLRVATRTQKGQWSFVTVPIDLTARSAYKALMRQFLSASGDFIGTSTTVWADLQREEPANPLATRWRLYITLREQ